jgi:hypothetical protein
MIMNAPDVDDPPAGPASSVWALIIGLAGPALLWPLTALTGLRAALGGGPAAMLVITVTAVLWIGVVGFGRVPGPVRTLTLTGLLYGLVTQLLSAVVTDTGADSSVGPWWTALPVLLLTTLLGFLTGLAAAGVQRLR